MARGINKVILVGTMGRDPETKYMPSGKAVTNISLATSEQWKDRNTGEKQDRTEWHRIVMFDKLAEIAAQYLKKGQQVYIEGKLQTRKWQGQDGQDRYTTEIVADNMQMLGGTGAGGRSMEDTMDNSYSAPPSNSGGGNGGGASRQPSAPANNNPPPSRGFEDFDDDIPF